MEEIVEIEGLAYGGYGYGRLSNGKVVFVPLSAPKDRLMVKIVDEKNQYAFGEIVEIIEESPYRIDPDCEVFGRCGGCQFLCVDYKTQVEEKIRIVKRELVRNLKEDVEFEGVITGPEVRYRRRAKLFVENRIIGFRMARSEKLVPVGRCRILTENLEKALLVLYSYRSVLKKGKEIFLGESNRKDWVIVGIRAVDKIREIHDIFHKLEEELKVKVGLRILYPGKYSTLGKGYLRDVIMDSEVRYDYFSFFQSNLYLTEDLVRIVFDLVDDGNKILELFAGSGTFTIPLSKKAKSIVAVEIDKKAVKMLESIKGDNVEVINRDVEEFMESIDYGEFDVVIVDPPRVGLTGKVIEGIKSIAPDRIIYVSCNPSTLSRDIAKLGYRVKKIWLIDMFPQTYHIELVTLLEK